MDEGSFDVVTREQFLNTETEMKIRERVSQFIEAAEKSNVVRLIELLGKLSIFFALTVWVLEIPARKEQRALERKQAVFRAYELLAVSEMGSIFSMKKGALQDLVDYGLEIKATDFSWSDLAGMNLQGAVLDYSSFWNSDLSGSDFSKASLINCDFTDCIVRDVKFTGANLSYSIFNNIDFEVSDFHDADVSYTIFKGCDLSHAKGVSVELLKRAVVFPDVKLPKGVTATFDGNRYEKAKAEILRIDERFTEGSSLDFDAIDEELGITTDNAP